MDPKPLGSICYNQLNWVSTIYGLSTPNNTNLKGCECGVADKKKKIKKK